MRTIVDGFFDTARAHAAHLAVRDETLSLSYGELAARVSAIAAALAGRLERPGPVAILTPHDARSPAALLGVLASGRGVIPLDADHPDGRNKLIAHHSGAVAVVTIGELEGRARGMFGREALVLDIDVLAEQGAGGAAPVGPSAEDLAVILYTSGSTGTPKGAFQTHGPVLSDLLHSVQGFDLRPGTSSAAFYPPAVAAGLRAMLGNLLGGAALHLLAPRTLGSEAMAQEIRDRGITLFRSSATLFRHVAQAAGQEGLPSLKLVALGGDRVDWADYDLFRRVCGPDARMASHLGATECAIYAEWFVDESARGSGGALPVGRTNPGYRVVLQDEDGAPVRAGETGEFVIESSRVAQGYWRDPERTAAAFGVGGEAGLRTYRTGDLGRLRPDGLFEVAGRRDHQIKLRGFRIELGEIESALRGCSGIKDAAVVVRRSAAGAVRSLVAYIQLKPGVRRLLPRHVTSMLAQRLPAHMLPVEIIILDALPWLANFKVDRKQLEAMDAERTAPAQEVRAPGPGGAAVVRAFQKVLRRTGIGPEDDLLSLGGDSLQAVDIALEIEIALGVRIPPEAIDIACPIGQLAVRLGLDSDGGRAEDGG